MIVKCNYYSDFPYPKHQVSDSVWEIYKTRTYILKYLSVKSESFKNEFYINSTQF